MFFQIYNVTIKMNLRVNLGKFLNVGDLMHFCPRCVREPLPALGTPAGLLQNPGAGHPGPRQWMSGCRRPVSACRNERGQPYSPTEKTGGRLRVTWEYILLLSSNSCNIIVFPKVDFLEH